MQLASRARLTASERALQALDALSAAVVPLDPAALARGLEAFATALGVPASGVVLAPPVGAPRALAASGGWASGSAEPAVAVGRAALSTRDGTERAPARGRPLARRLPDACAVRAALVVAAPDAAWTSAELRAVEVAARLIAPAAELAAELAAEPSRESAEIPGIVARTPAMREAVGLALAVAPRSTPVLILGEGGTGKAELARAIHARSGRAERPFERVRAGELPQSTLEAELFGSRAHGLWAEPRPGRVDLALGGTLYVDEIGDLPPATQVALLAALSERVHPRSAESQLDLRWIFGTDRDPERLVAEGRLRRDLYDRLSTFPIRLPPLRQRKTELPALARALLEAHAIRLERPARRLSAAALDALLAYAWPGNLRELETVMERAAVLAEGPSVEPRHLPEHVRAADERVERDLPTVLDDLERDLIVEALRTARGNMAKAARRLGISERIMGLRVKKHRLSPRRFRSGA